MHPTGAVAHVVNYKPWVKGFKGKYFLVVQELQKKTPHHQPGL